MLDLKKLERELSCLSQKIKKNGLPAFTKEHKQVAIIMAAIEKTLIELFTIDEVPLQVVFMSLFFLWLAVEAPMHGISEEKIDHPPTPIDSMIKEVVNIIQAVLVNLPDTISTTDMTELGNKVDLLKSCLPNENIQCELTQAAIRKKVELTNTRIYMTINRLFDQSFYPEIISNIMFGYWLRISTLHNGVPELYYQKMEHYFTDIIKAVRKYLPNFYEKNEDNPMPLTPKQNDLVQKIDLRAKNILLAGGGDEALLTSLYDIMSDIKKIMDSNTRSEMDLLCQQYDGFYCYMKLLEKLASGIASGKIQVPRC